MLISLVSSRLGSVYLLHQWQKEEEEGWKKEEVLLVPVYWSGVLIVVLWTLVLSTCLLSICLYDLPYESLHVWN